tara:strand:+ start:153 stop:527 length:375 start_codon:yes stop_codon:yes gene_type:complete
MLQLIAPLLGLASSFIKNKQEISKVKQEGKLVSIQAETEVKRKVASGEIDWDSSMAEGSKDSWKDEYFVIVLSIPMIGAFIPSFVPYIQEGFIVLDTMPDYYKGFLGAAVAASFGIKSLSKWKK